MAELLVKAQNPNNNPKKQIGDIVCVRPDGWKWGKEECLPRFIVIKVPSMTVEECKEYEKPLLDPETSEFVEKPILKYRKYNIKSIMVESAKQLSSSVLSLTKTSTLENIETKTEAIR